MFLCIMDDDTKEMVTTLLPALTRCPQPATEYLRQLLQIVFVMIRPHPDPLLNIRHRISDGQIENWDGFDVFSNFSSHRYSFYSEIYHPQIEPQELYFSGHQHFHAIHTQVVIDNAGYISYAEARGDAKQFTINWCK